MNSIFDNMGRNIRLGQQLARGGEGVIYEVADSAEPLVAKIYDDKTRALEKQHKLSALLASANDPLREIASWPTAMLYREVEEEFCGFLMPRLVEYDPLHHMYGPSHRKKRFPSCDWAGLVLVARNVAAAFDVIHEHGYIVGDINEKLLMVAGNGTVKFIDCDSFQVAANGALYLCRVGVPHFTPPELPDFKVPRTRNHDNFGLALLIFHLLMMGRHPFDGVYPGRYTPLDEAIRQFRYVFSRNSTVAGMKPPPNSVSASILTERTALLFERAFTEDSVTDGARPSPTEWVAALEELRGEIRTCGRASMHKFFGGLTDCPWCSIEQRSGIFFFPQDTAKKDVAFSLAKTWARIQAIRTPGPEPAEVITGQRFAFRPRPLPEGLRRSMALRRMLLTGVVAGVAGSAALFPAGFIFELILGAVAFKAVSGDAPYSRERESRRLHLATARHSLDTALKEWKHVDDDAEFQEQLKALAVLRNEYNLLETSYEVERQRLHSLRRTNQLRKFLDRFFISEHDIPGIDPVRKATLLSFGIETAADVDRYSVMSVPGFGPMHAEELEHWRRTFERRFVYDPSKDIDPADMAALDNTFSHRRKRLEGALLAGPEQLTAIRNRVMRERARLRGQLINAKQQADQAEADMTVFPSRKKQPGSNGKGTA
jgi:DNA-binding helix-hairpin-helix protein with protein kinase domain